MERTGIDDIERALADPGFRTEPHAVYHRLREVAPVYWSPSSNEWLVTSYALVDEVLTTPLVFSSVGAEAAHIGRLDPASRAAAPVLDGHFSGPQLNISDPPDHTRLRRAFGRPFLPREVARHAPTVRHLAERSLDRAARSGAPLDLVRDLAAPLPVEVIAALLGIPGPDRDDIPALTLDQRHFFGEPPSIERARSFDARLHRWRQRITALLDERRASPRDDVLTRVAEVVDADAVSLDEALATFVHLVIAGNSTTTALIGNALYALLDHPDQLELVRRDRRHVAGCVEETLRVESPLPRDRRIARAEYELGGQAIRAGDRVSAVLAAANRDPAHFPDPDRFDITRDVGAAHHAAFGRGIHLCLGAPVARLEAAVAIEAVLDRVAEPRLPAGFRPRWHPVASHHTLTSLPIDGALAA